MFLSFSSPQGEVKEKVKIEDEEKLETSELSGRLSFFSLEWEPSLLFLLSWFVHRLKEISLVINLSHPRWCQGCSRVLVDSDEECRSVSWHDSGEINFATHFNRLYYCCVNSIDSEKNKCRFASESVVQNSKLAAKPHMKCLNCSRFKSPIFKTDSETEFYRKFYFVNRLYHIILLC